LGESVQLEAWSDTLLVREQVHIWLIWYHLAHRVRDHALHFQLGVDHHIWIVVKAILRVELRRHHLVELRLGQRPILNRNQLIL